MEVPVPIPIFRFLHFDNLETCLRRGGLHAPNHTPSDGFPYRTIHNEEIQQERGRRPVPCGPGGVIHDYVSFYFGPRSPMLFQLHTGWVPGYNKGQEPLVYLVSSVQKVQTSGARFVFSDGHAIAAFTKWFDNLKDLGRVDWETVNARMWRDTNDDPDRQRRKQAEFLVHQKCDWSLVEEIGVLNGASRERVEGTLGNFVSRLRRPVRVRTEWYY